MVVFMRPTHLWFSLIQYAGQECDPVEAALERNELSTLN